MLKRFEDTKVKSAIIVTASVMGAQVYPGLSTYSCSKSFASFVAEALNYELAGKVDCMSYQAGEVATKLMRKSVTDI